MKVVCETKTIVIKKYESADGIRFNTEQECIEHEKALNFDLAKSVISEDCYIPYSGWDQEPLESKIYFVKNHEEYNNLEAYHQHKFDEAYWDEPENYPAAFLVISREYASVGYEVTIDDINNMTETFTTMMKYYHTAILEQKDKEN